jgi:hypothetical protein
MVMDIRKSFNNFGKNALVYMSRWEGRIAEVGFGIFVGIIKVEFESFRDLVV